MLGRMWHSLPWIQRDLGEYTDEQELQDVQVGRYTRENSKSLESLSDDIDANTEIPPVFSALQQSDIDALEKHLDDLDSINKTKCGGLTPLHVACHFKNMQILKTILARKPLINQLDGVGNTALHIAVAEKWHEGVQELLQHGASPDLKNNPRDASIDIAETPLHIAIRQGDEVSTCLILETKPDLALCDSTQRTVLHLAAKSLNDKILSKLLDEKICQELLDATDNKGNSIMHAALSRLENEDGAVERIIRILFEEGLNVNSLNHQNESPLYLAARTGQDRALEFLLMLGADPRVLTSRKQSLLHAACRSGNASCLRSLLNTGNLYDFVTKADDDGKEPFDYALRSSSLDCCELLLSNGDHLTRKDKDGITRCSLILDYIPSAHELLKHTLDKSITLSDKAQHDPDFRISFDYSSLLAPVDDPKHCFQSSIISDLNSNSDSEMLLKHPLVESFLYRKWNRIKIFFYANVLNFFIFLLMHSFYIISVFRRDPMMFSRYVINVWVFRFLHVFMYMFLLVPEVIITLSNPKKLIKHWESLTKFVSLISSAFVVFTPMAMSHLDTQEFGSFNITNGTSVDIGNTTDELASKTSSVSFRRHIAATSAFFGWVELMMLFGRFPALGVYTLMFTRTAKSMLRFMMAFVTLLVGFAICFLVLFYMNDSFSSFGRSIVKVLMMMIGEIDYASLVDDKTPVISIILLVVFLFLVSILMINLLIGVAVNDISNLEFFGQIERLSKQASFLESLENLLFFLRQSRLFPRRLIKFLGNMLNIKPTLYISLNKTRFKRFGKYRIPAEIIEAALAIRKTNGDSASQRCHQDMISKEEETQKTLNKILQMMEALHLNLDSGVLSSPPSSSRLRMNLANELP
ncbi:transient receptor potential channel pyrexia-like [Macrobrachium rosenbergii]|uniref:transient receptor potential channel pyrexia-like n=1 Tax=Macrobrachium rosenbergii TaxID=79674 RepID=UPI0034D76D8A